MQSCHDRCEVLELPSTERGTNILIPSALLFLLPNNSIFASFNDTFVHVTDMSGKETVVRVTGKSQLAPPASIRRPTRHRGPTISMNKQGCCRRLKDSRDSATRLDPHAMALYIDAR